MRILFIVNNLIIGGVEKICYEIIKNIDRDQYQIDFLVAVNEDKEQYYMPILRDLGCTIYKGGAIYNREDRAKFLNYEKELLKKNQYDAVHSHVDFLNAGTLKVAHDMKIKKRISHVHTTLEDYKDWTFQKKIKKWIQTLLLNFYSTKRLGCSQDACKDYYGSASSIVLNNGFCIRDFLSLETKDRDQFGLITVGRIVLQKNPIFICDVMKELYKIDHRYHLTWIGTSNMLNDCREKVQRENIKNINFIGATTDVLTYYEKCAMAIYPSVCEGLCISLVESQLAHCFSFYSDTIPEDADLGYAMKISIEQSAAYWAKMIHEYVIDKQKRSYQLDSEKCLKYDIHTVVNQLCRIYNS